MVSLYLLSTIIPLIHQEGSLRYIPSLILLLACVIKYHKAIIAANVQQSVYILFTLYLSCFLLSFLFNYAYTNLLYFTITAFNFALFIAIRDRGIISLKEFNIFVVILFFTLIVPNAEGISFWPSIYGNTNACGVVAFTSIYFILVLQKVTQKKYTWALFATTLVVVYLTKSRSCELGILLFFLFMFLSKIFSKRNFSIVVIGFLVLLSFVYIQIIRNPDLLLKVQVVAEVLNPDKGISLSERDIVTPAVLQGINEHPLGIGMEQAPEYIEKFVGRPLAAHNVYLGMAFEGGLIMIVAYVFLLFALIYKTPSRLAASFIAAFAVRCFFDNGMPFAVNIGSAAMVLPFFLNEFTLKPHLKDYN